MCLAALAVSTLASWFFFSRWEEMSEKYTTLLSQQFETAHQLQQLQDELNRISPDLEVMRDPEYLMFDLIAVEDGKDYRCRVYWNSMTKETLLDPLTLPEPDSGKQYRLFCQGLNGPSLVKLLPNHLNRDQLLPLGNVEQSSRWWITYGTYGEQGTPVIIDSKVD